MEKITNFEPKVVGVNEQLKTRALQAWNNYIDVSCDLLADVVSFLDEENIETKIFLDIVSLPLKSFVVRLYELSGNTKEGLKTDKLIDLGLINNDYAKEVESNYIRFHRAKKEAESLFNYDLEKLRSEDSLFSLSEDFKEKLNVFCTVVTESEKQNEALKHLKMIISGLNYFAGIGIIKNTLGIHGINILMQGIKLDKDRKGFEPALNVFKLSRWKAFYE